jgi:hypothetical protein
LLIEKFNTFNIPAEANCIEQAPSYFGKKEDKTKRGKVDMEGRLNPIYFGIFQRPALFNFLNNSPERQYLHCLPLENQGDNAASFTKSKAVSFEFETGIPLASS